MAAAATAAFASLPKTGRPQPHEHTTLAAITLTLPPHAAALVGTAGPLVVALATGTKCLPGSKRAPDGSALHDCHAEVLARRALVRWLYDELFATAGDASTSLVMGPDRALRPGVELSLFVSHPPCGDAAILHAEAEGDPPCVAPAAAPDEQSQGRTGAKPMVRSTSEGAAGRASPCQCLPVAGDVESYASPQATGVVRRKPGRGEPTLSVSCSDKLAKWSVLGAQGALLGGLLSRPVYLRRVALAATPETQGAVLAAAHRALVDRTALCRAQMGDAAPPPLRLQAVALPEEGLHALGVAAGGAPPRRVPSGTSVIWWAPPSATWRVKPAAKGLILETCEVPHGIVGGLFEAVSGKYGARAGRACGGADRVPPEGQSLLCRAALLRRFAEVATALGVADMLVDREACAGTAPYHRAKERANPGYVAAWAGMLAPPLPLFDGWILKPRAQPPV